MKRLDASAFQAGADRRGDRRQPTVTDLLSLLVWSALAAGLVVLLAFSVSLALGTLVGLLIGVVWGCVALVLTKDLAEAVHRAYRQGRGDVG